MQPQLHQSVESMCKFLFQRISAAFCQKSGNGVSDIILLDQIRHGHAGEHALLQCMLHIARIKTPDGLVLTANACHSAPPRETCTPEQPGEIIDQYEAVNT